MNMFRNDNVIKNRCDFPKTFLTKMLLVELLANPKNSTMIKLHPSPLGLGKVQCYIFDKA